jgi:hypothetical protein
MMKAVQYYPKYCDEAKRDMEENGPRPFTRWDSSHDLSILDSDGNRYYVGQYGSADKATQAGIDIEMTGVIPRTAKLIPYGGNK